MSHSRITNQSIPVVVIAGKVWHRQDKKDYYLVVLDADKIEAIKEICTRNGKTVSLQEMAQKTLVEQHKDCLDRAHICFYSPIPFPNKSADSVLGLEVKGLMFCSPSLHKNGHPYEIMGTSEPIFLTVEQATELLQHIDQICIKYGLRYLESNDSVLNDKIRKLVKSFVIDKTVVIPEGIQHSTLISIANPILFRHLGRKNNDDLEEFFTQINDTLCQPEPLPEREIMSIWKSSLEFVAKNKNEGPLEAQYTGEEEEQSTVEQLVEVIMSKYKIKTLMDTEEMVYYKDGFYRMGGEQLIKIGLEEIAGYSLKINKRNEIIAHIRYRTMVNREDFDIINVRNDLLNIMTGELKPHTPEYLSIQ